MGELTEQEYKQALLEVAKWACFDFLCLKDRETAKLQDNVLAEFDRRFDRAKALVLSGKEGA